VPTGAAVAIGVGGGGQQQDQYDEKILACRDVVMIVSAFFPIPAMNANRMTSMNSKCAARIVLLALILRSVTPVFAAPVAQLVATSGNVSVSSQQQAPQPVSKGNGVENGMIVTTGTKSSAVLQFQDGQIIALQSSSVFRVNEYKFDRRSPEKSSIFFSLAKGGLRAVTGLIGDRRPQNWKLEMPAATAGIRGTDFLAVIYRGVYARVISGDISLSNSAGTEIFSVGKLHMSDLPLRRDSIPYSSAPASTGAGDRLGIADGRPRPGQGTMQAAKSSRVSTGTAIAIGLGVAAVAAAAAAVAVAERTQPHSMRGPRVLWGWWTVSRKGSYRVGSAANQSAHLHSSGMLLKAGRCSVAGSLGWVLRRFSRFVTHRVGALLRSLDGSLRSISR
jgi:hypothetical protein